MEAVENDSKLGVIKQLLESFLWVLRSIYRDSSKPSPPATLEVSVGFATKLALVSSNLVVELSVFWFSFICVGLNQVLFRLNTDT